MKKQPEKTEEMEVKVKNETVLEQFDELGTDTFEQDENASGYDQVYFVKMKTKDAAYFEFSKKIGDVVYKDPRTTIVNIDGKPTRLEMSSYTYENKEIKTVKLYISKIINEKPVLFILSSSYTQVARSIINALLGCHKPLEKVNISLYKNASGYTSVKMSINGAKSEWRYSIDEQRKHIETITNKAGVFVSNDYTELDNLLEDKLREHLGVLFPEIESIRFIENNTETFGEDETDQAENFFELGGDE